MPTMPRTLRVPGRPHGDEAKRDSDRLRRKASPWRAWYNLALWRRIREEQLSAEPLCRRCAKRGETVQATVVNHETPHRGDWDLFVSGPFASLCKPCHDGEVQREERAAARSRPGGGSKV